MVEIFAKAKEAVSAQQVRASFNPGPAFSDANGVVVVPVAGTLDPMVFMSQEEYLSLQDLPKIYGGAAGGGMTWKHD